jgi:hypothetical protein
MYCYTYPPAPDWGDYGWLPDATRAAIERNVTQAMHRWSIDPAEHPELYADCCVRTAIYLLDTDTGWSLGERSGAIAFLIARALPLRELADLATYGASNVAARDPRIDEAELTRRLMKRGAALHQKITDFAQAAFKKVALEIADEMRQGK